MRRVLALTLCCLPAFAFADCTAHLAAWAQSLHPQLRFDDQHSACKVSPVDARRTLAALLFVESEEPDMTTYGMEVLTAYDGVIERHVHESGAIISDALQFEALSLDTARYQLNPGTRAFGVRVAFSGSSRVNPYSSTELSLYVEDGAKLRKVLDKLPVVRSGGEWDGNCAGEFYDINSSLAIGKATAHGYAALDMTDKITGSRAMDKGGECISQDSRPTLKKSVLTYNGKQYVVPEQSESR